MLREFSERVRLRAYRPQLRQAEHRHHYAHFSLVLGGTLQENSADRATGARAGMFAVRPGDFGHEVRFGERGAIILSMAISPDQFGVLPMEVVGQWVAASNDLLHAVIAFALERDPGHAIEDCIWDLLAQASSRRDCVPPLWLRQARDRLSEEHVSIGALAAEAGVHRVHFSRAFARSFGMPPSVYRRRERGFRALTAAIEGKEAAESAYDCGFADQSHMSRVIGQMTGASFKRLGRLGAQVTSVQE
jgi:AraC family transcriptional regulator